MLAANDIVEIIGASVDLKPAGSGRMRGLCPFHQEKTPSFHVNRERQFFHCFGCNKSGDALTFLCEHEGISFMEALRTLAERGGVRLPAAVEQDDKAEYIRTQLFAVGQEAATFFTHTLDDPLKGGLGRQYLKTRSLKPETVQRFALGYAPDSWEMLRDALHKSGYKDDVLDASGLVRQGERGGMYAFFRNRLMVPIRDVAGHVVAFGGRDLGSDVKLAKYINTPENAIYKKSRILYGLYEARDALRKEKRAILVEGYFDLMRCFDSGIENVVASCGTALTADQARLLKRYVQEAVVVYDGDAAGVRAALRGVGVLTAAGLTVRAMLLPGGMDPDDYIRAEGGEAFRKRVEEAQDFVSFYIHMNESRLTTIEGRTDVARELFAILLAVDDSLRREEYLKRAARELRLDEYAVQREFARISANASQREPEPEPESAVSPISRDDVHFVAALMRSQPLREHACKALEGLSLQPGPMARVLIGLLKDARAGFEQRMEDEDARRLLAAAANSDELSAEHAAEIVEKRLKSIRKSLLSREYESVQERMRETERQQAAVELPETERQQAAAELPALLSRLISIRREMEKLGAT